MLPPPTKWSGEPKIKGETLPIDDTAITDLGDGIALIHPPEPKMAGFFLGEDRDCSYGCVWKDCERSQHGCVDTGYSSCDICLDNEPATEDECRRYVERCREVAPLERESHSLCVFADTAGEETDAQASSPFSSLRSAESLFTVGGSSQLEDLRGLECLESIAVLSLYSNDTIVSLNGLKGIRTMGGLDVSATEELLDLRGLASLEELGSLDVLGNEKLPDLRGLEGLTELGGAWISDNEALSDFAGLDNVSTISASVLITTNTVLTNLHGLEALREIGSDLDLRDNPVLEDLSALESLERVGGDLTITGNLMLPPAEVDALLERIEIGGTVTRD